MTAQRRAGLISQLRTRPLRYETSVRGLTGCDCERYSDYYNTTVRWPVIILISRRLAVRSICQLPRAIRVSRHRPRLQTSPFPGQSLPALRECQDWCVEPKKAQRSRCLPVSQPGRAVHAGGGELPPVRAERRVHLVGVAGEDAVQCGCLGAGQTPPGCEIPRRQQRIQPVTVDPGGWASQPSLQGRGHLSRIRQPREQVGMLGQPPPSFL